MYILNCTQSISNHLPEGGRLKATVVSLVAFGALSILLGTLSTLSMQGVLQTTLAAVGPEGTVSLVSGGFLIMLLGQRLYAARKGYVGQRVSFTHSQVRFICEIVSEQKSSVSKNLIPGYFFVRCEGPQIDRKIVGRVKGPDEHFITPIEIAQLSEDVEVAVFVEDPSVGKLRQQQDRYLHFQQGDDHRVYFESLLRLICKENLSVSENLGNFFPLSSEGKVILLHLEKGDNFQQSIQHFFNAMPTRWYTALREVLKSEWCYLYAEQVTDTISAKREREHKEFQAFLARKRITEGSDPVEYTGEEQDLTESVAELNRALTAQSKQTPPRLTLIYQRTLSCRVRNEQDPEELAERFGRLFTEGVIHSFEQNGERFTVRC